MQCKDTIGIHIQINQLQKDPLRQIGHLNMDCIFDDIKELLIFLFHNVNKKWYTDAYCRFIMEMALFVQLKKKKQERKKWRG